MLSNSFNTMMSALAINIGKIKQSDQEKKVLIENTDALIFSMLGNGQLLSFNMNMVESVGCDPKELLNKNFIDLFDLAESRDLWRTRIEEILALKVPLRYTYEFQHIKDGRTIFDCRLAPILSDKGEVLFIVGLFLNIVDLVKVQENIQLILNEENTRLEEMVNQKTKNLEAALDELVQKEKLASLGSLVSGISHEINTPLGVAVTATSFLEDLLKQKVDLIRKGEVTQLEFDEFISEIVESVMITSRNIHRAKELIENFKQISVYKSNDLKEKFDVVQHLELTIFSLQHELKVRGHSVSIQADQKVEIFGNLGSFYQVFTNLIMNSLIHGFEQGQGGCITIKILESTDKVIIHFEDDGKGIADGIAKKVFDPFFTTSRAHGGSGLGLNIVHNIITSQFGGHISLDEERSKGTLFIISIPKI